MSSKRYKTLFAITEGIMAIGILVQFWKNVAIIYGDSSHGNFCSISPSNTEEWNVDFRLF